MGGKETWLIAHDAPRDFLAAAGAWLEPQEVEANLVLGLAMRLRDAPDYSPPPWYLATVHAGDEEGAPLLGVALRTPPWHLVLHVAAGFEERVAAAVADDLLVRGWPPSGVNGREPASLRFAELWEARTGQRALLAHTLRVFKLRKVIWPRGARGRLRPAIEADFALLAQWIRAFHDEATPGESARTGEEAARLMLDHQTGRLWEDEGEAVCLVATNRRLPHGIVVGPVYTPPELRGRGYASNAVAHLSALQLSQGQDYVALFTDLANPTSNHIYQAIGYEPVCDYADYSFVPVDDAAID